MKKILLEHWNRYPKMEVADAVKLLYQSEFGGGHMIADPHKSLDFLEQEWSAKKALSQPGKDREEDRENSPSSIYEYIGDGMYRMHLQALEDNISPKTLNQMFVLSAQSKSGTTESFEQKLKLLLAYCQSGELPFDEESVKSYLADYKKKGYPAVSHSMAFKEAYHPAYRIVEERFVRYYPTLRRIDMALKEKERQCQPEERQILVAIDGMCGSGKTTLGQLLSQVYDCNLFHMDDFFLRPEQKTADRMNQDGGNVDYERFKSEILDHISESHGLSYRVYDCKSQTLKETVTAPWKFLNIIEGSYSQHPYFGKIYDLRFFCETDGEEQLRRIRLRNGEKMAERFRTEWIPRENRYFKTFHIRENSIPI